MADVKEYSLVQLRALNIGADLALAVIGEKDGPKVYEFSWSASLLLWEFGGVLWTSKS